jgi:hypothetical protein
VAADRCGPWSRMSVIANRQLGSGATSVNGRRERGSFARGLTMVPSPPAPAGERASWRPQFAEPQTFAAHLLGSERRNGVRTKSRYLHCCQNYSVLPDERNLFNVRSLSDLLRSVRTHRVPVSNDSTHRLAAISPTNLPTGVATLALRQLRRRRWRASAWRLSHRGRPERVSCRTPRKGSPATPQPTGQG